ncbi:Fur family transcriptional regulator [Pseudodesulfovibrio sp.]|uniref:Fur family transcriptional regulator n=1 Tax=unclassified Pseudodesulfovibrio TaxID=2661612 RepID=UPI003B002D68
MKYTAQHAFIGFLRQHHLSMTSQRKVIVETFLDAKGHLTADRLFEMVRDKAPDIGQATVYRTLKLLVDSGLADSFDPGGGVALYEQSFGQEHHDHLICVRCGRKVEICSDAIEARQEAVAKAAGFTLTRHRMYLYGICPDCRKK